ncbi:MAG: N-acetylmuramoyl-L-alanine amidase [Clostridia bacterium]|nr:N-acetylmuramoyl-L-alanine amidase [Clostridia bacterium]
MAKKVYVGIGHGGSDSGAVANGFREKDLNLSVGNACSAYLRKAGVEVKQSRTDDRDVTINTKVAQANSWGADLVLDIHHNAGGGDGAEVYYSRVGGTSKKLATNILTQIVALGQQNRGEKIKLGSSGRDYFGMVRDTYAPAVLVECAFMDSKDIEIVDTEPERVRMGEAIAKGILKTLGIAFPDVFVKGDIDGDGKVTAKDARLAAQFAARLAKPTADQIKRGDMDGDGKISAKDARTILRKAAKLE